MSFASEMDGRISIVDGVKADGHATDLWLQMVAKKRGVDLSAVNNSIKPFTSDELAWAKLIHSRQRFWAAETKQIASIFPGIAAPEATIVLGNRGAEDAFTHDPHTIGFDLERLYSIYGGSDSAVNRDRIDRFFRHEYTHLLQKAWYRKHPIQANGPLELALVEMWAEGLGNFYSLSESWYSEDGHPTDKAFKTLRILEPRLLARLAALSCASPGEAAILSSDLSNGRFDRKWGALPVALWLKQEASRPEALREFVEAGPEGIWGLIKRHISSNGQAILEEIRLQNADCVNSRK